MKTTTLFLTGGNGFIGRNIQEAFSDRYTIIAPTHRELDLLDIEKVGEFLKAHPSDVLIHAANVGGTRKSDPTLNYLNPNLRMFVNLLRCRKYFKKLYFLVPELSIIKNSHLLISRKRISDDQYQKTIMAYINFYAQNYWKMIKMQ